jgi:ABC-type uncharacterized transport system involved in gliding motility auxiliary subunit
MVTYILVFVAILAAVNYLGVRYNKTYDATENKLYSLSGQTFKVLDGLAEDLKIYYFDQTPSFERVRGSLVQYENASSRVSVSYIDPDSKPELTREMNVSTYGTLFVEYAGNREKANSTSEEDITNTIIRVIKGQEKTACFLSGHGEADLEDTERNGFGGAKTETEGANYKTRTVSLLENPLIPADCTALVIAGPANEYLEPEIGILKKYVESGGRAVFLLDNEKSPRLAEMLAAWGIRVKDDLVVDLSGIGQLFGGGPLTPLVAEYESHPITDVMAGAATFFPMSRTVEPGDSADGWTTTKLFGTTAGSFATEDFEVVDEKLKRNPDKETQGPISIAVAATFDVPGGESGDSADNIVTDNDGSGDDAAADDDAADDEKQGRVVVIGTSIFARNNFLARGSNSDLFLNILSWLSSDEDLISIRPKDPADTPLDLSSSDMSRVFFLTVLGFPLMIIVAGINAWWRRR